jgi:hypothetical protein
MVLVGGDRCLYIWKTNKVLVVHPIDPSISSSIHTLLHFAGLKEKQREAQSRFEEDKKRYRRERARAEAEAEELRGEVGGLVECDVVGGFVVCSVIFIPSYLL